MSQPRLTVWYNTHCPVCDAGIVRQRNKLRGLVRARVIEFRDLNDEPGKAFRGHADNRQRMALNPNGFPNDRGVSMITALPTTIVDYRDRRRRAAIQADIGRCDPSAQMRLDAEGGKVFAANRTDAAEVFHAIGFQVLDPSARPGKEAGKNALVLAELLNHGER